MGEKSSVPTLTRDGNYPAWAGLMRAYLITQNRLDRHLDATPRGADTEGQANDVLCKARVQLHVAGPLLSIVQRATTAKQAWDGLYDDYKGSLVTRQPQLTAQLTQLSQGDDSIIEYVDRLLSLRDEFEALEMHASLPLLASQFVRGLKPEIRMACAPTLHQSIQKGGTVDDLGRELKSLALLLPEVATGSREAQGARVHHTDGGGRSDPSARDHRRGSGQRQNSNQYHGYKCHNCGKMGHIARDCRSKKQAQGHTSNEKGPKKVTFSKERAATIMTLSPTVANLRGRSGMLWLDSGATHHVVCDSSLLQDTRSPSVSSVVLGGGEEHAVTCEGDLFVTGGPRGSVLLTGVLHVPTLGINLVSTPQLTSKKGSCWEGEHFAYVYDPQGRVILRGHKLDGMYRLDCQLKRNQNAKVHVAAVCADTWHRRLGHVGHSTLQQIVRSGVVRGLEEVTVAKKPKPCEVCAESKLTRAHFPRSSNRARHPLDIVHSDTMGPLPVRGLEDELYVVTALDDFTGYAETLLVRSKSDAAATLVDLLVRWQRQTSRKLKILRTDQGTEFKGVLAQYCTRKGITRQVSTAYSPEQNGRAERLNRTLIERARALLLEHRLPKAVWSEAIITAAYLRNRVPGTAQNSTPYELFYGQKPDMSHLRVYGCKAFVYVEKGDRDKLDPVSEEHALVGYAANSKAYRLLRPGISGQHTVIEAISVRFHEDVAPTFLTSSAGKYTPHLVGGGVVPPTQHDPQYEPTESGGASTSAMDAADSPAAAGDDGGEDQAEEASVAGYSVTVDSEEEQAPPAPAPEPLEPLEPVVPEMADMNLNPDPPHRYPKRDRQPPQQWYRVNAARLHALEGLTDNPATYREAMQRPDKDMWQQAIDDEMASLLDKQVYTTVTEVPHGARALPSKLVLTIKRDEKGNVDKYKARLVAKGFRQLAGRDYDEVFAPTAQHVTLRVLLAVASAKGLVIGQLDVRTAFLNGKLRQVNYVRLPPELGGDIVKLDKALYGLKQAAREWFETLRADMIKHGFTPSQHEPCLFFRGADAHKVYVMVHVDDTIIVGSPAAVEAAKQSMKQMYEVKDLGTARHFLGMNIARNADGGYSLTQPKYVDDLLVKFHMVDCKTSPTPMTVGLHLSKHDGQPLPPDNLYQSLVGALIYLAVNTRPDISHAVGILSRFMSCPTDLHWEAAKHVLRYLKGTTHLGLLFAATKHPGVYTCEMYTDADFAADVDKRRSITGAVMLMQGAAVLWLSKLQTIVATSTAEAEFIAASVATKEGLWVRKLLSEFSGKVNPLNLAVDNQSALVLISEHTAGQSGRTKHIDIQFQHVRDRYQRGDVTVRFVSTTDQRADMFTKQLGGPEFKRHRELVMGM